MSTLTSTLYLDYPQRTSPRRLLGYALLACPISLNNPLTLGSEEALGALRPAFSRVNSLHRGHTQPVPHTYNIRVRHACFLNNLPTSVSLTSAVAELPLPDPRYLALHAACAKVAPFPGPAKHIHKSFRELEDTKVLASNGSSAEALQFALGKTYFTV